MKGKNPTVKQKRIIILNDLNPCEWLVLKSLNKEIHIKHRVTEELKILEL